MNQQRSRRFRSAQEAKDKDADNAEFAKMLRSKKGGELDERVSAAINKKTWDSNAITPGTPFMDILAASLRYWVAYKLNTDPAWAKVRRIPGDVLEQANEKQLKVIISDATVPGEGEHKIMEFIRSQRSSPEHDPNTRHVIYGLVRFASIHSRNIDLLCHRTLILSCLGSQRMSHISVFFEKTFSFKKLRLGLAVSAARRAIRPNNAGERRKPRMESLMRKAKPIL
jgi:hypothetical protein